MSEIRKRRHSGRVVSVAHGAHGRRNRGKSSPTENQTKQRLQKWDGLFAIPPRLRSVRCGILDRVAARLRAPASRILLSTRQTLDKHEHNSNLQYNSIVLRNSREVIRCSCAGVSAERIASSPSSSTPVTTAQSSVTTCPHKVQCRITQRTEDSKRCEML